MATPTKQKKVKQIDIVRDTTFVRVIADRVIVINVGNRNMELSCLQVGHVITSMEDHGTKELLNMSPVATEVVRIRMEWSAAIDAAMLILHDADREGKLNKDELLRYLNDNLSNNSEKD